ncbi:MAG: alpha/beta hydrolase [Tetrasphaera sp.]
MAKAFRSEPFEVDVEGGAQLFGEVYLPPGQPDPSLPAVILAHGWTLNRTVWGRVIRGIQARLPVAVIAYDQRAHGQSTPGSLAPSVGMLGDDLAAVLADTISAKSRFVLVGHSMGGMTVMAYAGRYSDQLIERANGVVLLGTASAGVERPGWFGRLEMGVMTIAARGPRVAAGFLVTSPHQRHLNFGDNPDPRDVRLMRRAIAGTKVRDMGRFFSALRTMDESTSLIALAEVPTTIIVGSKDRLTPPAYSYALHEGIAGSKLIEVEGKGHMLGYEATDLVVETIIGFVTAS